MAKEQVHPAGREEKNQVWDWIIIGTGVGGSTFGHALAQAGRRVLFVEKGADHRVNRQKKPGNYLESLIPHPAGRSVEDYQNTGRSHAKIWDATRNRWLKPILGSGTGGSSALFGMVMERFWKEDFESGSCHKQSDSSLPPRWPIRFDEMMPYYMEAERLFGVSSAGSDPLRNEQPFDHLSRPALSREGNRMISSFQRKGLHPYTLPLARKWGTPCPFCQSWLCHHDCKNDAAKVCLEPALQAHGASLLSKAEVLEILSERSRVTGVKVALEGQTHVIQAENVALAAGALFSPVLLLKSRSSVWPEGLANESGQVGKNLMRHYIELMGIPSRAGSTEKGDQKEIGLNDFYLHDGQKYGTLGDFGAMPPVSVIMEDLDNDVAAGLLPKFLWGMIRPFARWVLSLIVEQRRFLAFIIEDLPFQENRVEEGTNGADVKIHYSIRPSEWSRIERARALARKALGPRGILLLSNAKNSKLLAHACGTCRMGEDPTTSVVNRFNRAHGVENLYVVDSSFFPSSGGMNPALTIAANALRVARHIVETKGDSPEVKKRALHAPPVETTAPHSQKTVVDLFLERSVTHSDQTFCQFKSATGQWTSMTYRTARQHVLTLASGLNRMGLKPGEGLAIMARTRWEWVALELAALRAGAFITGIETYGSKEDIQFRLEHSGVRGLVIETADRNLLPESTVNKLDFLILLDAPDLPGDSREVTFQQLETMGTEHTEEFPLPSASDPAALLYTSGTTGTPKAMRYRHHQIIAAVEAVETTLPEVGPNDSVLCWLPLAHLFQRMISYVAISRGATMAFSGDPKNVMEAIKEIRPTVFLGVPRFFEKLHQGMETKIASVPHWVPRFFLNARLRKALGDEFGS
jgi:choline dehydrogenase-like flavoprotein